MHRLLRLMSFLTLPWAMRPLVAAVVVAGLGPAAWAQGAALAAPVATPVTTPGATPGATSPPVAADAPEYRLGPGDAIRVQVFQNPDLTVEARVSEGGSISYPLIGLVRVGGLTLSAAEQRIAEALQQGRYLKSPQVNINVLQVRGSQVAVLGQVARPGRFALDTANVRASELLAAAGGVTALGDDRLVITGQRDGQAFRRVIDIPALFTGGSEQEDVVLQGGDALFVPRAAVFYIYGEAQRPGPYRIERGMTVMQALAAGGGITPRGSQSRLRLHRAGPDGQLIQTTPQLTDPVQPNDVIYVRESLF